MVQSAGTDGFADRRVQIETPEHVRVAYPLADLGSRFLALLLDTLLIGAGLAVLWLGVPYVAQRLGPIPDAVRGWGTAVLLLLSFAWAWGYFVYFEGLRDGQTPGKRKLRIRAVHDGGYALGVQGAAIRNLLRLVDIQPLPSWLAGGVTMLLHPQTKRLGDIAAGTVVVRDRFEVALPEAAATELAEGPPRLDAAAFAALSRYIGRRGELRPAVRERIAGQLAARIAPALPAHAALRAPDADAWLIRLEAEESARQMGAGGSAALGSAQAAALARHERAEWTEFRALLERAQRRGLAQLPEADVRRFATLYRATSADLARARTYGGSAALLYSLERTVGAGHNLLYQPAERSWRLARGWLARGFPALFRARRAPVLLAAVLFYLPALLVYGYVRADPPRARELIPTEILARAEEGEQRSAAGRGYVDVPEVFMPVMASGIIANNVQVTFLAFAGGILAGIGTIVLLVVNGVHLGAVAALFGNHGLALHLWSFVLPHGVIELTAICIAGGAGLWLGSALVLPGRQTRSAALVERGREAVSLLLGTTMLLVIAGLIEGFISPSALPVAVKLSVAAVSAVMLAAYLGFAGRPTPRAAEPRDATGRDQSRPARFTSR